MKKIALIVLLIFSFCISKGWSAEGYSQPDEQPIVQTVNCNDPALSQAEKKQCVEDKRCQKIWAAQPWLEDYIIPILQDIARAISGCLYNLLGVTVDTMFWIPLACDCNKDATDCAFWKNDRRYNLDSLSSCQQ